ncbi:MAG: hypothetical protein WEA34_03570 [Gemmatimonadota bacterium]
MRYVVLVLGVVAVLVGGYSLLGGSFSMTRRETVLDLGPVQATAETQELFALPPLVAAIVLVLGLGAVVYGASRS